MHKLLFSKVLKLCVCVGGAALSVIPALILMSSSLWVFEKALEKEVASHYTLMLCLQKRFKVKVLKNKNSSCTNDMWEIHLLWCITKNCRVSDVSFSIYSAIVKIQPCTPLHRKFLSIAINSRLSLSYWGHQLLHSVHWIQCRARRKTQ